MYKYKSKYKGGKGKNCNDGAGEKAGKSFNDPMPPYPSDMTKEQEYRRNPSV